jgi:hypothetical protein
MDADDVSYPHRFASQIAFLDKHPELAMAGSGARFIDDKTGAPPMFYMPPLTPETIRQALYFNNCFVHPTWLFRADALASAGPYSLDYPAAEDYEFLRRITPRLLVANVPEVLVDYRISTGDPHLAPAPAAHRLKIQIRYMEPLNGVAGPEWQKPHVVRDPAPLLTTLKAEWRSWHLEEPATQVPPYHTAHRKLPSAGRKPIGDGAETIAGSR